MADSDAFDWLTAKLERHTALSRLEARGTVRLVLKEVGLDPSTVSAPQLIVVLERLLGPALAKRKVDDADPLCKQLSAELAAHAAQQPKKDEDSAYEVFSRLESGAIGRLKR